MRLHAISTYLNGALAFLACPCHAHFYLIYLSGTSLGAFMTEYEAFFFFAMAISFPVFVLMSIRSYHLNVASKKTDACAIDCKPCNTKP